MNIEVRKRKRKERRTLKEREERKENVEFFK